MVSGQLSRPMHVDGFSAWTRLPMPPPPPPAPPWRLAKMSQPLLRSPRLPPPWWCSGKALKVKGERKGNTECSRSRSFMRSHSGGGGCTRPRSSQIERSRKESGRRSFSRIEPQEKQAPHTHSVFAAFRRRIVPTASSRFSTSNPVVQYIDTNSFSSSLFDVEAFPLLRRLSSL